MFYGAFNSAEDVFSNFTVSDDDRKDVKILWASYENENYEGSAGVVFLKEGKIFSVYGGHCSCHGLEGQWEPQEITLAEMRHYLDNKATPYGTDFGAAYQQILMLLDNVDTSVLTDDQIVMMLRLIG